jgi:hypothetical protein
MRTEAAPFILAGTLAITACTKKNEAITLAGIELAHRIRKRQFSLGRGRYRDFGSLKQLWERALA